MGEMELQTESESEELSLAVAALEEAYAGQDQGGGEALAALERVFAEQDEGIETGIEVFAALFPTLKGITLGEVLATHPAFELMAERTDLAMREVTARAAEAVGGAALNVLERAGQQMSDILNTGAASTLLDVARGIGQQPLIEFPQFRLADNFSIFQDAAESLRLSSGIADSLSIMRGWEDGLASFVDAQREQEQAMLSMGNFARTYAAEQDAVGKRMNESLSQYASALRAEQQQREKAMYAAFADMGRWQGPSILWRDAVHSVHELAPAPLAEQIEIVQVDDEITLESWSAALAEGRLPVHEAFKLVMQHMPNTKPGRKEPPIPEQLSLVEGWHAVRGKMLQQRYCDRVGISKASLNRYERTCRALGLI